MIDLGEEDGKKGNEPRYEQNPTIARILTYVVTQYRSYRPNLAI